MTSHSRSILVLSCEREGMQMLFDSKAFYRSEIMLSIHVQVRNEVGRHGDSHNCTSLFWFEWASWLVAPISRHVRIIPSPHQHWYCCWAPKVESPQIESDILSHYPMHRARLASPLRAANESLGLGCHDRCDILTVRRPAYGSVLRRRDTPTRSAKQTQTRMHLCSLSS